MIDLFSGYGGFSFAAEKIVSGYETIQFVENDSYCQKVLKKHWPNIPIHGDIKTYKPKPNSASVIVGGFPCTDISQAGLQQGITTDTRSGLFYELMRVVRVVRPKYVIMENVAAILTNGMGIVLGELSKARYNAEWGSFQATDFVKAIHYRDRWWLLAINRDFTDTDSLRYRRGSGQRRAIQERQLLQSQQKGGETWGQTQRCNNNYSEGLWPAPTSFLDPNWRDWSVEPAIRGINDGTTPRLYANRRERLKLLGNGLIPQCAAIPLQRVLDLENES